MKKYAVITGASSGIGAQFMKELAKRGYHLVPVARRKERMEELCGEIQKKRKVSIEIFAADLSKEEECKRLYAFLEDKPVSIFINCAGFGLWGRFLESDPARELDMIKVNVTAVHLLTKLMLQKMEKQGGGYLLNVASCAGLLPAGPYMATYYATKSYVAGLTRGIAQELKESGSRVYVGCLCPGPVNTEFDRAANVEFALKGISPGLCVRYALKQMAKRKTVIVPAFSMRATLFFSRFLPQKPLIYLIGRQQKKKGGI